MTIRRHGLAQRRKAVGFTQEVLAERLGVERSTVVRWEAGETEPLPYIRPKMARVLQVSIDQLAQLINEAQQDKARSEDHACSVGEPVVPPSPLVSPTAFSASRQKRINPDAHMLAMQSFRAADKRVGGGHLYVAVVNYLHAELAPRIFGVSYNTDGRQLFASAAALTEMAGWMAHDAGRDAVAQQHFLRSLDLVKISGDRQLAAHIFASMSHLAHHHHRPDQAIQLARQGAQELHGGPLWPALKARLLTMQAKGMAALHLADERTKLLIDAETALGLPDNAHELSPWISQFDEGSFANEAARCMHQLGDFGEAQRQAQRVLELRPRDRTRSRALGQLILVTALIAQGRTDQACILAQDVLDFTQSLGSYVLIQQLLDLKELLRSQQKSKSVVDFLACLEEALRERLCLYQWLPKDGHGHNADFLEDV